MDVLVKVKQSVIDDFYEIIKNFKKAAYDIDYTKTLDKIYFLDTVLGLNHINSIYAKLI